MDEKPDFLSFDYVKANGVLFDENVMAEYEDPFTILYDKPIELGGKTFTGLLYELYENDNVRYYAMYQDGYQKGEYVSFYYEGTPWAYRIMYQGAFTGVAYHWYPNGKLQKRLERFGNSRHYKVVEYDEDGNITRQGEI